MICGPMIISLPYMDVRFVFRNYLENYWVLGNKFFYRASVYDSQSESFLTLETTIWVQTVALTLVGYRDAV